MPIIVILILLAFIGIGLRISRKTNISFWYVIVCIIGWIGGAAIILNGGITEKLLMDIGIVIIFPIVLIVVLKLIIRFFKWAIGGIMGD